MAKRVILANDNEPRAGDFAFDFYRKAHPVTGDSETVGRLKSELKGLRGQEITVKFNGKHIDSDSGDVKKFVVTRRLTYRQYADLFGPGSAYASAASYIRDKYSNDTLVIGTITIDDESDEDDNEYDEE
jgi:hypothetical protein